MTEGKLEIKSGFDLTSRSTFSTDDEVFTSCSVTAFVKKSHVPMSHKIIADDYMVIKKIFKFQAVMSRISAAEKALLNKYDFNTLEFTTAKQMYEELLLLQKWAASHDARLRADADQIVDIRVRELKFITASRYACISNEIYKGYIVFENYLKEISRFRD